MNIEGDVLECLAIDRAQHQMVERLARQRWHDRLRVILREGHANKVTILAATIVIERVVKQVSIRRRVRFRLRGGATGGGRRSTRTTNDARHRGRAAGATVGGSGGGRRRRCRRHHCGTMTLLGTVVATFVVELLLLLLWIGRRREDIVGRVGRIVGQRDATVAKVERLLIRHLLVDRATLHLDHLLDRWMPAEWLVERLRAYLERVLDLGDGKRLVALFDMAGGG